MAVYSDTSDSGGSQSTGAGGRGGVGVGGQYIIDTNFWKSEVVLVT